MTVEISSVRQHPGIVAIDAHYQDDRASVAGITFDTWTDPAPGSEITITLDGVADYEPGAFWRRELPCILAILDRWPTTPPIIVLDGYVWLDGHGRKGLGAHLHDALDGRSAIVGVAKHPFRGASHAAQVLRGTSQRPLYVTAEGLTRDEAARCVGSMHGPHRLPTLLKRVDQLCRSGFDSEATASALRSRRPGARDRPG